MMYQVSYTLINVEINEMNHNTNLVVPMLNQLNSEGFSFLKVQCDNLHFA